MDIHVAPVAAPVSAPRPRPPLTGRDRAWLVLLAGLAVGAALVWAAVGQRPDGRLHLYVLDVGQGDALLLTTPQGRTILVDGGPDPARLLTAVDRRLPFWQRRLDLLILTHPHEDHLAGLIEATTRYTIGGVVQTPFTVTNSLGTAWERAVRGGDIPVVRAVRGQVIDIEPGLSAEVLAPDAALLRGPRSDINNASLVLRLRYGPVRLLLTGDIGAEAMGRLLAEEGPGLDAAVLKVVHHGSDTPETARLLAAVRPQVALISVGSGNSYGHPAPGTLAALTAARVATYRTDLNGTVDVSTDGQHLWVRAER